MGSVRRFLILTLMPLTVFGGMPHVACRCSNGDVVFFCPRINQSSVAESSACDAAPHRRNLTEGVVHKPCCRGNKRECCGSPKNKSKPTGSECCATGCRCTPVYLEANPNTTFKKVCLPDVMMFALLANPVTGIHLPRIAQIDLGTLEYDQRVPDDLIVRCQRWLI